MSVLYFVDDLLPPSVLWMRRMLEFLGDDVSVLAAEKDPGTHYRERWPVVDVREGFGVTAWRVSRRLGLIPSVRKSSKAIRALARAYRSDSVDRVLVHFLTQAIKYDRVWSQARKPVFVHCHGYDVTWDLRLHDAPDQMAHETDYVDRVLGLPDYVHFIANSQVTMKRISDIGIAESRIHLKYLGASVGASPPAMRASKDEVTILYLGRLVDCKGPDLVIQAFDKAARQGLRGRLILAGDGPLMAACEQQRSATSVADRITLLGSVDAQQAAGLRLEADIFTAHNRVGEFTRQEEAFGVSFVEAMADGLPVVSGRNGSLPEIVDHGEQGLLFEPEDIDAQADAFLRLAADPELRARLGTNGWQRARERFSLEIEEQRLRELLQLNGAQAGSPRG